MAKMGTLSRMKFFIVDDDPFSRMLYRQYLLNLGYKDNTLFDNGVDCINRLDMHPDVVLLDYNMEPLNGLEIIKKIKKINPEIHLLVISAINDKKIAEEAVANGAVGYVIKGERDLERIREVLKNLNETCIA